MGSSWLFHVEAHEYADQRALFITHTTPHGRGVVANFEMRRLDLGLAMPATDAVLIETREDRVDNTGDVTGFLQAALETAWRLGMRPTGYEDARGEITAVKGELTAVRDHLSDMRKLAKVPGV